MAEVNIFSDFRAQENKVWHCFHCPPPCICHEVMQPDAMILVFWIMNFKPAYSLSSFTFIKRLFSSSSLSAIRVVSFAYLRLFIFLLAVLIPAFASSSPAFHMSILHISYINKMIIHSLDVLLSQVGTVHCFMYSFNCCFLTCIQISQEACE